MLFGESQCRASQESLEDHDVSRYRCMISVTQNSDQDHGRCDQPMLCFARMKIAIIMYTFWSFDLLLVTAPADVSALFSMLLFHAMPSCANSFSSFSVS